MLLYTCISISTLGALKVGLGQVKRHEGRLGLGLVSSAEDMLEQKLSPQNHLAYFTMYNFLTHLLYLRTHDEWIGPYSM